MRIWAFPIFYPYEYPGMKWHGIFVHRQYKGLIANGAELQVILPIRWNPPTPFSYLVKDWQNLSKLNYPLERIYDGIKVNHPKITNYRPARFLKSYPDRFFDSVDHFFRSKNIKLDPKTDIFYSQWIPEASVVQLAAQRYGVRSAIMVIGDDVLVEPHRNPGSLLWFKKTWSEADIRLSVADYLGKESNKLCDKEYDYQVVRRGVNYDYFRPLPSAERNAAKEKFKIPQNKLVILSIGTAIVRKGWLDLFDAIALIKDRLPDFIIAGVHAGHAEIDLTTEAAKRGISDHFLNINEVDPKEINEMVNTADIFCLPSHWEGIANSVVESMAAGLPVITTNVCGHPELIQNGYNGLLLDPHTPKELADKILQLATDQPLREELGKNARQFIIEKWGNFNDNSLKLYNIFDEYLKR